MYEDCDSAEFNQRVVESFPKLQDAGGYELLRVGSKHGQLEVIENGYTPEILKEVVHQAKIYVRPIQRNLSMDICDFDDDVSC